ncbi:ATP-binding protein [Dialister micraerophilus]|uniref:ATP-binding protein n=1 Tax=Dialister micraerophilus TaxID=309120 RepID=UPI0023F36434|nr:ATP-binding protein [Dialister micraerophilus]
MNITKGIVQRAVKSCIYGVEGIGKSTFASQFPKPLFLDLDKGTARLDVDRIEDITTWSDLMKTVQDFAYMENNPYETLIIDTADAAARLCEKHVIQTRAQGKTSIEDIPYGKGYKMLAEEFATLLIWFEVLIEKGFNVVILAHAMMKTITKPDDDGQYDHWELKLPGNTSNKIGPLVKEWADLLLFADFKTIIVTDGLKKKARGGKRLMYATHTPFADAKNRFELPDQMPFDYKEIEKIIPRRGETKKLEEEKPAVKKQSRKKEENRTSDKEKDKAISVLKLLMADADISEERVRDAVTLAGKYPEGTKIEDYDLPFIQEELIAKWEKFSQFVNKNIPF